jgi:hypothetical protein
MTEFEDDLEWEDWLAMSDEQQEDLLNREMNELQRRLDAMSIQDQVAHHRHFVLESIIKNRQRLRDPKTNHVEIICDLWRKHIRNSQVRLLKLRVWRETGTYPGEG